jgi:dephospho-CoA kinase
MAKKIFITGISGTGKTTIENTLNSNGIYSIGIDEWPNLCFWKNKTTGEKVEYEAKLDKTFIDAHDWICDIKILKNLLEQNERIIVVLGSSSNQNDFLNLFDKILLLQCKPETFIKRIIERKDNDFGKDKSAQELILSWYEEFENNLLKKGAVPINTDKPLKKVVENIMKEIQ